MKYNYKTVYSRRRSVSVSVSPLNKITVHCPLNFPKSRIDKFLNDKSAWIDRILQKNSQKLSQNEAILSFNKVYIFGEQFYLFNNADKNAITDEGVFVRNVKKLSFIYKSTFSASFLIHVQTIADIIKLVPEEVKIRDYKSRWGCCDAKNRITFNYKIFMLPQNLQDYVVVHELCHIKFHNHSQKFWQLVEKFLPNYKVCRKELKNYDFLTRLY